MRKERSEEIPNGTRFSFGVKNATIIKNQTTDETQLGVALRRPPTIIKVSPSTPDISG